MPANPLNLTLENTIIDEWHERDRNYVILYEKDGSDFGASIAEWWDDEFLQAVEDGFLDPRRLHESAFEYASEMGYLDPANRIVRGDAPPTGWVIVHEELGVFLGNRRNDEGLIEPLWSSDAADADLLKGATAFSDEESARDYFVEDLDGEELADNEEFLSQLELHEVGLDVTPEGHVTPRRASVTQLSLIGVKAAPLAAPQA